jgi:hypothetical protein
MKVARLLVLSTGRLYLQETFLVLISVRDWGDPRDISAAGRIMSMKNSSDTIGNDPETFRFVVQCLNHCAAAWPQWKMLKGKIIPKTGHKGPDEPQRYGSKLWIRRYVKV